VSTNKSDHLYDDPIPAELEAAIGDYSRWNKQQIESEQAQSTITVPLYQYTGWSGLCGIIESQSVWFTDYRHLNDPSELVHGVMVAHEVLAALAQGADRRVGLFLQMVGDLLVPENFVGNLDFFTASFSKQRDDLGQWRAYGENGRGFALGLAPKMFEVADGTGLQANEMSFVGPVLYDRQEIFRQEIFARHKRAIAAASSIFLAAAEAHAGLLQDKNVGMPFMRRMANELIASPLIWNCMTSKHVAYENEREVRLVLMGQTSNLSPYVKTRLRGSETVPYIAHPFRIRETGAIHEIVVGPAAAADAEEQVERMLTSHGVAPSVPITRSEIPYRG
jgi:Protein of unknown function (DUF2971)